MRRTACRHAALLHRLEQRGLRLRRGAVDFICEQELRENWPAPELKLIATIRPRAHHRGADDVGRHEIGRELDPAKIEIQRACERLHELRLAEPRHAFEQHISARDDGCEHAVHDALLADDHAAHAVAQPLEIITELLCLGLKLCGVGHDGKVWKAKAKASSAESGFSLAGSHLPHGPKPNRQRQFAVLEDRASHDRGFPTAVFTTPKVTSDRQPSAAAGGTNKPLSPPQGKQLDAATRFVTEAPIQFQQRARIILCHRGKHCRWRPVESCRYPDSLMSPRRHDGLGKYKVSARRQSAGSFHRSKKLSLASMVNGPAGQRNLDTGGVRSPPDSMMPPASQSAVAGSTSPSFSPPVSPV